MRHADLPGHVDHGTRDAAGTFGEEGGQAFELGLRVRPEAAADASVGGRCHGSESSTPRGVTKGGNLLTLD